MMLQCDQHNTRTQTYRLLQHFIAVDGMLLHFGEFRLGKLAGLEQNLLGNADFADVMQGGCKRQKREIGLLQLEPLPDQCG
ncbi:hypothetical protein D3C73_1557210 [compost metagenome]